ncbi:MAG: exonuclease domain-containing protein [Candidatus Izemoplasmatales bacterium]|nr:exonuclease domain-containing protein [Candidatus Izemoplasmatales bacterium]
MTQYVYGLLHGVDEKRRLVAIRSNKQVKYYYMAKGQFLSFMQYFKDGIFVFLHVEENVRRYRGVMVQNVVSIEKLIAPSGQNPTVYYDVSVIKSGISSIVNLRKYKCFLDFEMSMPPYTKYETFVSEIIQVGYLLCDELGNIVETKSLFLRPTLFPKISERTKKFLHIEQEQIEEGILYREFYDDFTAMLKKYKPMVVVWGANDQIELRKMNMLYSLSDFTIHTQFIDLLKLHKTYFGLKNDLGLFSAYNMYSTEDLDKQKHDAFEDARVTKEVFYWFLEVCNGTRTAKLDPIEKVQDA